MRGPRVTLLMGLVIALGQLGFLAWMIQGRAAILRDGREVLLEVQPVDPRDLLRGDYVVIGYDISQLPRSLFEADAADAGGDGATVYVRLAPDEDGLFRAVSARYGAPPLRASEPEEVDMRGVEIGGWDPNSANVMVQYRIERFYLPEGEGRPIERGMGTRPFRMRVAVADDGTPQIKAFLDGETVLFEEPWY